MRILIQSAKIFNKQSPFHLQTKDILIVDGKIDQIEDTINDKDATVFKGEDLSVSSGWTDLFAVNREPGNEHKDTIENLIASAAAGGFVNVAVTSGSTPSLDNRSQVEFIKNRTVNKLVNVLPVGTVSVEKKGKDITELFDMHQAGAVAFSDGKQFLPNPETLKRALLYVKPFGGKIVSYPEDESLSNSGMVNEGKVAATLGMKVRPSLAEEIGLVRDLYIAEYTDSPIHFTGISSEKSLKLIKRAKKKGHPVTCDTSLSNLFFNDEALTGFDSNLKVLPPIRSKKDQDALIEGLLDGTIDAVSSGHTPQDIENKMCEFDHAAFGASTIESVYPALNTIVGEKLGTEELVELLTAKASSVINQQNLTIEVGASASLTLFSDKEETKLDKKVMKSSSKNSPFIDKLLKGKVYGIINNNQTNLF